MVADWRTAGTHLPEADCAINTAFVIVVVRQKSTSTEMAMPNIAIYYPYKS